MIDDTPEKSIPGLLVKIIQNQTELSKERVLQYNQKWNLPPDSGLHVTVQFLGSNTISNRSKTEDRGIEGFYEIQDLNTQEMYQIVVMSRNMDAPMKKQLVLMALASVYAQQVQEENSFHIAPVANFSDISEIEGAAILYRFALSVTVHAWYRTERRVDYYNDFPGELWTEQKTEENAYPINPLEPYGGA